MVPSARVSQLLNHLSASTLISRSLSTPASTKHSFSALRASAVRMSTFRYPQAGRPDFVEELHGVKVADPYRWLEDPKSKETQAFITSQNTLFEDYISRFSHTKEYRESLTKTYNFERYGTPWRRGNRWYYSYNEGLKAQNVHYAIENDAIDSKEQGTVFFDPNTLSEDGTLSLNTQNFSKDGSLFAYALSQSGSDWCHARIRNVATGKDYPDKIQWIKFSALNLTPDNKGLLYQRFPEPVGVKDAGTETGINRNAMLYYHKLGTEQSEDILIYSDPKNPNQHFGAAITFDEKWIRMTISESTDPVNKFWLAKLDNKGLPANGKLEWIKIKDDFDSGLYYIANNGNVFYFESNLNAPRTKIVRYDLDRPEEGFVTIVPEQPDAVMHSASLTNEKYLCLLYLHNVQHKALIVPLESVEKQAGITKGSITGIVMNGTSHTNGSIKSSQNGFSAPVTQDETWVGLRDAQQLDLPVGCSITGLSCRRDEKRLFLHCVGYTLAGRVYQYTFNPDIAVNGTSHHSNGIAGHKSPKSFGTLSIWRESVVDGFEPDRWAIEQAWVPNPNDGVQVPMYIVRDKSLTKTGDAFCLLYGYGGFNISLTPSFSPSIANMLTHSGGIYCVANIRGGGEFGEQWHKAAVREKRPVAFSDFEECGRYLIREKWTRKEKLVCQGGSNGGALVGAVMNRAGEEIFAAGVAQVGVLDLLRFHLFTVGYAWKPDFGDPDVKEDFEFIYKWSPYHNIRDGKSYQYPAMLCETSDHDDRVVPLHSFKFIAALQHAAGETNRAPLLLRHHLKAGHGAGKPTQKIIEEASERFAFMMTATGTKFRPRETNHRL